MEKCRSQTSALPGVLGVCPVAMTPLNAPSLEQEPVDKPPRTGASPTPAPTKLRFHPQTETCTKLRAGALAKLRFHPEMKTCVDL